MAGRTRSTKTLSQRIDREYFKRLYPIPRWRRLLTLIFSGIGLAWVAWSSAAGSGEVFNAGPLARAHHLLEGNCATCHAAESAFGRKTSDQTCQTCHNAPDHKEQQAETPSCMSCHVEHRGADRLTSMNDASCTQCHGNLVTRDGKLKVAAKITGFDTGHPDLRVKMPGATDPGTIKFGHEVHMKAGLRGPQGPVQLECSTCHRLTTSGSRLGPEISTVNFEDHCESCHRLEFHRRVDKVLPHEKPEAVLTFAREALGDYIAAHPGDVNIVEPALDPRILTPRPGPAGNAAEWIRRAMEDTQTLMWRKTCIECHTSTQAREIPEARIAKRWMAAARFDHAPHQLVACAECHGKAATSKATADILLPDIGTCQQCHRSGRASASADCAECHVYHDWSKAKPVDSKRTIQELLLR